MIKIVLIKKNLVWSEMLHIIFVIGKMNIMTIISPRELSSVGWNNA